MNAGSSSLRLHVVDGEHVINQAEIAHPPDSEQAVDGLRDFLDRHGEPPGVIAHRLVHGGDVLAGPTVVTPRVRAAVDELVSLAPLHMPGALALLDRVVERLPDALHLVCPDTAFHRDLPEPARTYPVPAEWRRRWGLRRYGFHGISFGWAARRAGEVLGRPSGDLQLVLAHLSGGSSVVAVRHGHSADTSMGFTPLEGTAMAKRSGSVDPGMLIWLLRQGLDLDRLDDDLNRRSGLLGVSERSDDTRDLVPAAQRGDSHAELALEVFAHRARREIAACGRA